MYRVQLVDISKSFGGVAALKNVSLKIRAGEIHALAGENGAGKSTLMKILSGACIKDSGRILIDENEVQIRNTHDSKKLGIGIIYQEFSLVPSLTVAENIFLRRLSAGGLWIKWKKIKHEAVSLMNSIGFSIDPGLKVEKLSVAYQQIIEICKALSERVKILILDEPSAVLGPDEIKKLFETLKKLKAEGVAIIYITHHLSEIFQIADRVSVLKDGTSGDSVEVDKTDKDKLIRMMLGRSLETMFPDRKHTPGDEILKAKLVMPGKIRKNVSLSVRSGEILGLAGLVGSGRTETVRALFGADKTEKIIHLGGKRVYLRSPGESKKSGIGMVPEDRKKQGVILSMTIRENLCLSALKQVTGSLGFIRWQADRNHAATLMENLNIKAAGDYFPVRALSGGNQQKVSLAKWISRSYSVLIIDEPTRGIDVGAKVEFYHLINEIADRGVAVIMISSEFTELMGMSDRILVMRKGEIRGELLKKDFSSEKILRLAIGE